MVSKSDDGRQKAALPRYYGRSLDGLLYFFRKLWSYYTLFAGGELHKVPMRLWHRSLTRDPHLNKGIDSCSKLDTCSHNAMVHGFVS